MEKVVNELKSYLNHKKVLVTCSCGVDSMTLLHLVLKSIPSKNIVIAHVNHQKRKESIIEEEYIRNFAKENNLKLEVLRLPKNYEGNFQEWARNKRYEFFYEVLKKYSLDLIMLAHHADDNLETILMRLIKTSSLKGYAGIEKYSQYLDTLIYRPLLNIPKEKIVEYAKQNNITYFEDSSNSLDDYTRNRIRHYVIPLLKEENSNLYNAIEKYSTTILSANKLLEKVWSEFIETKVLVNNNDEKFFIEFQINDLMNLDEEIRIHVLFRLLKRFNLSRVCLDNIYKQITSKKNNIVTNINNELSMIKEYGKIIFTTESIEKLDFYLQISEEKEYLLPNNQKISIDKNICYFKATSKTLWYNINNLPLIVRTRKNGDKISLKCGTKLVSDYLTNKKIPYLIRKDILLLCDKNDNILYILGYKTK